MFRYNQAWFGAALYIALPDSTDSTYSTQLVPLFIENTVFTGL